MKKTIFSLFMLILFVPKTLFAITAYGYVYNTNDQPLGDVKISTSDAYKLYTGYSDSENGYYELYLENQKYILKYEKDGYESQTKYIDLEYDYTAYRQLERIKMVSTTNGTTTDAIIAGTWKGYYTVPKFNSQPDDVTAYLEQNGNHITGESYDQDGCEGTITGTIDGSIFTFEIQGKKSSNCCKNKFKGTAIITCVEDYMVMTFTIKLKGNCSGEAVGSGEFWKQ